MILDALMFNSGFGIEFLRIRLQFLGLTNLHFRVSGNFMGNYFYRQDVVTVTGKEILGVHI